MHEASYWQAKRMQKTDFVQSCRSHYATESFAAWIFHATLEQTGFAWQPLGQDRL